MNKEEIIQELREKSLSANSRTERLYPNGDNDAYKVCYRLIGNLLWAWKAEFGSFPTESDAIDVAKQVDPYFVELFKDLDELDGFKSTYQFHIYAHS